MTLSWSPTNKTGSRVVASFRGDEYQVVGWTTGPHAGRFSAFYRTPRINKRGKGKGERTWSMWFPLVPTTSGKTGPEAQMLDTLEEAKALCEAEAADRADETFELVVHEDDEDPERYCLRIELMNDCALVLSVAKTKDGYRPDVSVCWEGASWDFENESVEYFRQWVEVALGRRDHMRWLDCACCGRDRQGPMLQDQIWRRLADEGERILCIDCMQDRARQRLGRSLTPADLK